MFGRSGTAPVDVAQMMALREQIVALARAFDAGWLAPHEAAAMVVQLATIEHAAATLRALAAARAAEGSQWQQAGHRSPADWLAGLTGTTDSKARTELATGTRLGAQPE